MVRFRLVNISWWLVHVDCFFKVAVEKCILDVELSKRPVASYGQMKYGSYCCWFDDRTECFFTVDARFL